MCTYIYMQTTLVFLYNYGLADGCGLPWTTWSVQEDICMHTGNHKIAHFICVHVEHVF